MEKYEITWKMGNIGRVPQDGRSSQTGFWLGDEQGWFYLFNN